MFREMRRKKQALPPEICRRLLREEPRGVLAVEGENGFPYAVPMNFYYQEEENTLYFHGARAGQKWEALKRNPKATFTLYNQGERREGDWAFYVESLVVYGETELIEDAAPFAEIVRALGRKYYPTAAAVEEEMEKSLSHVGLIAFHILHMTGKQVHEK